MSPIARNIIAVVLGLFIGGAVNMGIISISAAIIPPPEGADLTTPEGLKAAMALMQPKHFILPFLAHALGTFVGALIAAKIAAKNKFALAMAIGGFFMIGGISMIMIVSSPTWFIGLDLIVAYIPMAFIGYKLAYQRK